MKPQDGQEEFGQNGLITQPQTCNPQYQPGEYSDNI